MKKSKTKNTKIKNKTLKNTKTKTKTKNTCDNFCKNDYLNQINKKIKESSKKYNTRYKQPSKKEKQYSLKVCKKTYCNEKCYGYDFFGDKNREKQFLKNIKNGFQKSYDNNKIEMFKKKGALSACVDVIDYDINHKGGSVIYNDGEFTDTDETYDGKPFFRKIFYYSNPPTEKQKKIVEAETKIVKILMLHPFQNIANYFVVNDNYVDMEELNVKDIKIEEIIEPMKQVKEFLQNLGIMYIDWKIDNIGLDKNGIYKLFDFDASGLIDIKSQKWIIEPIHLFSYKKAIENGCKTPKEIDDWSFNFNILHALK